MELKQNITSKKVRFYCLEEDDVENDDFRELMECDKTIAVGCFVRIVDDIVDDIFVDDLVVDDIVVDDLIVVDSVVVVVFDAHILSVTKRAS